MRPVGQFAGCCSRPLFVCLFVRPSVRPTFAPLAGIEMGPARRPLCVGRAELFTGGAAGTSLWRRCERNTIAKETKTTTSFVMISVRFALIFSLLLPFARPPARFEMAKQDGRSPESISVIGGRS